MGVTCQFGNMICHFEVIHMVNLYGMSPAMIFWMLSECSVGYNQRSGLIKQISMVEN